MTTDQCHWAVIPAAGFGQRFADPVAKSSGQSVPKQYVSILGKSVIEHSLYAILRACPGVHIVVAIADNDPYWARLEISSHPQIHAVSGGAQRSDSVLAGLNSLQGRAGAQDWVLVHDAARPCVAAHDIGLMLAALKGHDAGGLLSIPVVDTLKRADSTGHVKQTVDRNALHQAQTPQVFRYGVLYEALTSATAAGVAVSDESSAVERLGYKVMLHPGRRDNIKLTYHADLAYIEATLRQRLKEA